MKATPLSLILFLFCSIFNLYAAEEDADARRRAFIDNFISDYKTAYQQERIEYINLFFSSDALIITETRELSRIGKEIAPNSTKARPYKLLVENREEYLKRLKEVFDKNDGINLGISNIIIKRHPAHPDIYGVNFFQIWDDSAEVNNLENRMPGYIFFMLDFRDSEITPVIHVRTWQPKSNISRPADKYTLEDFRIISYR